MRLPLVLMALASPLAFGGTIFYTVTDTFAAGTPTTSVSAPNTAFTFTFSLPDAPVPTSPNANAFFVQPASKLVFGANTVTFSSTSFGFFTAGLGGGFQTGNLTNGPDTLLLSFASAQLFTGTTSNPAMLSGVFPLPVSSSFAYANVNGTAVNFTATGNLTAVATPEPSPAAFVGAGLSLLFLLGRFRAPRDAR